MSRCTTSTLNPDVETFANILFDKETQEQFLKECEELGIVDEEPEGVDNE